MFSIDLGIDAGLLRQKGLQKSMQKSNGYMNNLYKNKGPQKKLKKWPQEKPFKPMVM